MMNGKEQAYQKEDNRNFFFEGKKIKEIQIAGPGILHVYLSPEHGSEPLTEDALEQNLKIVSLGVDRFPIGFPDIVSDGGTYHFSYVFTGEGELSSEAVERFCDLKRFAEQSDGDIQLANSCFAFVQELYQTLTELIEFNQEVDQFVRCTSVFYWFLKESYPIFREPKTRVLAESLPYFEEFKSKGLLKEFSIECFEYCLNGIMPEVSSNAYDLYTGQYISILTDIPEDILENFLKVDPLLIQYHCMEASKVISQYSGFLKKEFMHAKNLLRHIFCNTEDGLITELLRAFVEIRQSVGEMETVPDFILYVAERYKSMVAWIEGKYECSLGLNLNKLNMLLSNIKTETDELEREDVSVNVDAIYQLLGSMNTIVDFSTIETEKKDFLRNFIENYKEYRPKIENIPIENRRKLNSVFFELYADVAARYIKEETQEKALEMFLVFGFIDSDLFSPGQVHGLYNLVDQYREAKNIFSMKSWLTQIAMEEKIPSVNELGVTYNQLIKEQSYRPAARQVDLNTIEHRLRHEVMNMLRSSHRVCSGQFGGYFPILHQDMIPEDIRKVAVTPKKIEESIKKILEMDYSAFHREAFYSGDNEAFKKEIVMKQVIPDFILIPVAGTRALMWQEISGVSKSSPGRFMVPIFTSDDLFNMLIKLTGHFRWELCRSVMGARWNDVSYSSLTSTYADYIENYKRNKNLTPEAKERLRTQIKRHQHNLRNIFSSDYELWLKYEYQGMRKLNKEARAILYRFCPFRSEKREQFIKQPVFMDIANRFENERKKTVREIESRFAGYARRGNEVDKELEDNLKFYKKL